jgi:hypothetical protein
VGKEPPWDGELSWIPVRIYDRDPFPREDNLDGWQEAARREVSQYKLKKQEAGGAFGKGGLTVRENQLQNFFKFDKRRKGRKPDDDAMEVDTTETRKMGGFKRLSPEERKKLQNEGRCFKCKRQGHMAHACPGKGQTQSSKPQNSKFQKKPSARMTEMADEEEATSEEEEDAWSATSGSTKVNKEPSLMAQINKLGTEDKEAIFARLINEGF